jgi:hypothetical protein
MKFHKLDFAAVMTPYDSVGDETVSKADFVIVIAKQVPGLTVDEVREFSDECPRIKEGREVRIFYKKIHNEITSLIK